MYHAVGGAIETVIGIVGEPETLGVPTLLVVDGGDRFLSNLHNLWHDISPNNSDSYRIPSSIGAQIGTNFGREGQKWGGIIDDAVVIGISGGPLQDGIDVYQDFSNGKTVLGALGAYDTYDGIQTIDDDINTIKGK